MLSRLQAARTGWAASAAMAPATTDRFRNRLVTCNGAPVEWPFARGLTARAS
jgi:hypothetical protein